MKPFKSTFLHMVELVGVLGLVIGIALLVKYFFGIDETPTVEIATGFVLAGIMKFLRADPKAPIKDFVNE